LRLSPPGGDIGDPQGLLRYESQHRRHSRPLYLATNAIVRLYTDPRPLAGILRGAALGIADRLRPFKQAALASLTAASNTDLSQYSSRGSLLSLRKLPTSGA
jgi:2-polyprenyl-6-methoxyphenol hydroxylase-like FAD-dependent oxidoreductase